MWQDGAFVSKEWSGRAELSTAQRIGTRPASPGTRVGILIARIHARTQFIFFGEKKCENTKGHIVLQEVLGALGATTSWGPSCLDFCLLASALGVSDKSFFSIMIIFR